MPSAAGEHAAQARLGEIDSLSSMPDFPVSSIPAVNVASVPQRSPLRYPGGKTWLIPHIREWLSSSPRPPLTLIEPFAGGGIVSLTAVIEGLVSRCLMAEIDRDVAAFWHAALRHKSEITQRILTFEPTRDSVSKLAATIPRDVAEHGFRTLVLNRTRRGGILAPGAALSKSGESGRGVASRWYPDTLIRRLNDIGDYADRITFCETDGVQLLETVLDEGRSDIAVFVDPPYTAGGKKAGARLYSHSDLDHERLFDTLNRTNANFLMTYDHSPEIVGLIAKYDFCAVRVRMKNTHHDTLTELIITPVPMFRGKS